MKHRWLVLALMVAVTGCSPTFGGDDDSSSDNGGGSLPPPVNPNPDATNQVSEYQRMHHELDYLTQDAVRALEDRSSAQVPTADERLNTMLRYVLRMSLMAAEPYKSQIAAYAEQYREVKRRVDAGTWTTRTLIDLQSTTLTLRNTYGPDQIVFAMDVMPNPGTEPNPDDPPRGAPDLGKTDIKNVIPWIFFKAWKSTHEDFVEAIKNNGDVQKYYDRTIKIVEYMRDNTPAMDKGRLMLYKEEYERLSRETKGFKDFTSGVTKDAAVQDLGTIYKAINSFFNLDRT